VDDDELLSIGAFARRSRLSQKALRLYERLGLLTPARVDEGNGYRRYRESQLEAARLVALLRRLDMPLAQVADVVAAPGPEAAGLVASYWEGVERRIASQRGLAAHLEVRLSGGEGSFRMFEIRERDVPEQVVLTEQRHVLVEELPGWIGSAIGRLMDSAQGRGGVAGPVFVVYHGEVSEDSDGPVEVCVPVASADGDGTTRVEPAHREAYTRLTKAQVEFPQILSAYDAVAHWIGAESHSVGGSPREVYFTDFMAAGPNDEVCDVAFPLA
jgi:DNA-binding transcriptional MerR regulator/effector-binding domain-containing protein